MFLGSALTIRVNSTNVAADNRPYYNTASSYSVGDVVQTLVAVPYHISTRAPLSNFEHLYESLADNNAGNPVTDPTKWLHLGPVNRYKMFDGTIGQRTLENQFIQVDLSVDPTVRSIYALGLTGTTQVTVSA